MTDSPFNDRIPGAYGLDLIIKGGAAPTVGVSTRGWRILWVPADEDGLTAAQEALATAINDHRLNWSRPRTRVYIAGPMTGLPDYNRGSFNGAAEALAAANLIPLNPAAIRLDDWADWLDYMRATARLLTEADGVALLPGWESSRGARIERRWATDVGIRVAPIDEWVRPS